MPGLIYRPYRLFPHSAGISELGQSSLFCWKYPTLTAWSLLNSNHENYVLFLSWRVLFLGSETAECLGFTGGWTMVTFDGCSGWSYDAGYGIAFFKIILSVCLPCLFFFPSLSLWDFAVQGDWKHSCPSSIFSPNTKVFKAQRRNGSTNINGFSGIWKELLEGEIIQSFFKIIFLFFINFS